MTWTVVAFTAVLALFVLVAISLICTAYERTHGGDPRDDARLRREAQEELLRKMRKPGQAP